MLTFAASSVLDSQTTTQTLGKRGRYVRKIGRFEFDLKV